MTSNLDAQTVPADSSRYWQRRLHVALVILLLLGGAGVRLYGITEETLWLDEHITWNNLELPGLGLYLQQLRTRDATFVPAYYVLLYYWGWVTDYSIPAARLLSVGSGLTTAFLLYLFAARAFGPTAGIVALAMTLFSNSHVYYTQEVRVYALYALAAVLSAFCLAEALKRPHWWIWTLHVAANALLVLSHYFGALIVIAEGVYMLLFYRRPVKRLGAWFAAQSALALMLAFWMLGIRRDVLEMTTAFLMPPQYSSLEHAFTWTALYWPRVLYPYAWATRIILPVILSLVLYCFWTRKRTEQSEERWRITVLCLLWLLLPTLLAVSATYLVRPALTLRYMLPASLPFFVLLGGAVQALPLRPVRWIAVAALLCLLTVHHLEEPRPFRPDMKRTGELLSRFQTPDTAVLLGNSIDYDTQRIYLPYPEQQIHRSHGLHEVPDRVSDLLSAYADVLVVCIFDYGRGYPSHEELENALLQQGLAYERMDVSADHYTFMTNANWPALSDVARRVTVYRVRER